MSLLVIFASSLLIVLGCEAQSDRQLIGEWLEYKIEKFDDSPIKIDMWGDGDSLGVINTAKSRFEFKKYGEGRDMTLPGEVIEFSYKVKENYLFLDDEKHLIEKITKDTLILLVPDNGLIDFDASTPYKQRIYFKRTK